MDSERRDLIGRLRELMTYRVVGEPVWLYVLWLTICLVVSVAIVWGIASGAASCPAGTPGCG
ncbi:MAG: hypothetical protein ABI559_10495 [Chloroflexota bacterium]